MSPRIKTKILLLLVIGALPCSTKGITLFGKKQDIPAPVLIKNTSESFLTQLKKNSPIYLKTLYKTAQQNKVLTGLGLVSTAGAFIYRNEIINTAKATKRATHQLNKSLTTADKIKLGLFIAGPAVVGCILRDPKETFWSSIRYHMLIELSTALPRLIWMGETTQRIGTILSTNFTEMFYSTKEIDQESLTKNQNYIVNLRLDEPTQEERKKEEKLKKEIKEQRASLNNQQVAKDRNEYVQKIQGIKKEKAALKQLHEEQDSAMERALLGAENAQEEYEKLSNDIDQKRKTIQKMEDELNTFLLKSPRTIQTLHTKQQELKKLQKENTVFPHALLIAGPPGTGKTESINMFAEKHKDRVDVYRYPNEHRQNGTIISCFRNFVIDEALANPHKHIFVLIDEFDYIAPQRRQISEAQNSATTFLSQFCHDTSHDYILPEEPEKRLKNLHIIGITNNETLIDDAMCQRFEKHGPAGAKKIIRFSRKQQKDKYYMFIKNKLESTASQETLKTAKDYSNIPGTSWRHIETFVKEVENKTKPEALLKAQKDTAKKMLLEQKDIATLIALQKEQITLLKKQLENANKKEGQPS